MVGGLHPAMQGDDLAHGLVDPCPYAWSRRRHRSMRLRRATATSPRPALSCHVGHRPSPLGGATRRGSADADDGRPVEVSSVADPDRDSHAYNRGLSLSSVRVADPASTPGLPGAVRPKGTVPR